MRQFLGLAAPALGGEARQDGVTLRHGEGASPGDIDRIVTGLGQIGEEGAHVGCGLEVVFSGHPPTLVLADKGAIGDAQQRIMRRVHGGGLEIDVVGRNQRGLSLIGPGHKFRLCERFSRRAMALKFDVKPIAEDPQHFGQGRAPFLDLSAGHQRIHRTVRPARKQDQSVRVIADL